MRSKSPIVIKTDNGIKPYPQDLNVYEPVYFKKKKLPKSVTKPPIIDEPEVLKKIMLDEIQNYKKERENRKYDAKMEYHMATIAKLEKPNYSVIPAKVFTHNEEHFRKKKGPQANRKLLQKEEQKALLSEKLAKEHLHSKNNVLPDNTFTHSLKKAHDLEFINSIMPSIQQIVSTRSPRGAAASKSNNLLRNTFSLEVYQEFLKFKQHQRDKKGKLKACEEQRQDVIARLRDQQIGYSPQELRQYSFTQKMEMYKQRNNYIKQLKVELKELRMKMRQINYFNINFFKKLEEENTEQKNIKEQLEYLMKSQMSNYEDQENNKKAKRGRSEPGSKLQQQQYNEYIRKKNILESKLFKKKFDRVQKLMSGLPKTSAEKQKPSVFDENIMDPKMNIPQNKELFNNVIKFADEGITTKKKNESEQLEDQIKSIKERIAGKIDKVESVNHLQFLQFIMANYDYNHDYWKLNKDLTLKLKEEEQRDAFLKSQGSLDNFQYMIKSNSQLNKNNTTKPSFNSLALGQTQYNTNPTGGALNFCSSDTFNLTQGHFGSQIINFIDDDAQSQNSLESPNRQKLALKLLNSPSEESVQNFQGNFQFQSSPRGASEVQNYMGIIARNLTSNDFNVNQSNVGERYKERYQKIHTIQFKDKFSTRQSSKNDNLQKTFTNFSSQLRNQQNGSKFKISPRTGAGDLGPNFTPKTEQFLPILKNSHRHIQLKDELKNKLETKNLTKQDWSKIGEDKILQTQVLENIYQKYIDYQDLCKKHKDPQYDIFDKKRHTLPNVLRIAQEIQNSESTGSLDTQERNFKRFPTKAVDQAQQKQKMEDAISLFHQMEKKGAKKHVGRLTLCNSHIK